MTLRYRSGVIELTWITGFAPSIRWPDQGSLGFEFCAPAGASYLQAKDNNSIPPEAIVRMMLLLNNAYVEGRMDRAS